MMLLDRQVVACADGPCIGLAACAAMWYRREMLAPAWCKCDCESGSSSTGQPVLHLLVAFPLKAAQRQREQQCSAALSRSKKKLLLLGVTSLV